METGLRDVHVWTMLAWQEIRQRYRRSTLGPFWLTISTAAMVGGMGPLYGLIFGQDLSWYFPYLAIGFVVWQLMASIINDSTQVFIGADQFIKQIKMPFSIHVLRMVWRNAIIFAHNSVIVLLALIFFLPAWKWTILLSLFGLLAILVNGIWLGTLLGLLCARFRDIPPIVASLVQIAFFLTPVLWTQDQLGRYEFAAAINPLTHLLEVVRRPLLGAVPSAASWGVVAGVTVIGFGVTLLLFASYRWRIAYWL